MRYLSLALVVLTYALYVSACSFSDSNFNAREWLTDLRRRSTLADGRRDWGPVRLIRLAAGESPIAMTEDEILELKRAGQRFMDVTDQDLEIVAAQNPVNVEATFPSAPSQGPLVAATIAQLKQSNLVQYVDELSAFNTRYYKTTTGAAASTAIFDRLGSIAATASGTGGAISVKRFNHTWSQNSIIARIEGQGADKDVVIAGAHLDSINLQAPTTARAPGSDDDGSGCANLIEVFRTLVATNFKPKFPIEFQFYSGEEAGLLGSQAIAKSYVASKIPVRAMMQLDMTAYVPPGMAPTMAFMTDHTNAALTNFTQLLATTYVSNVTVTSDRCGYGCSDHASWDTAGYPSTFPFESRMKDHNNNIHSSRDTITVAGFSYDHMHRYSQLLVAYFIELAI